MHKRRVLSATMQSERICVLKKIWKYLQGGAPLVVSWFIIPLSIDISTIKSRFILFCHLPQGLPSQLRHVQSPTPLPLQLRLSDSSGPGLLQRVDVFKPICAKICTYNIYIFYLFIYLFIYVYIYICYVCLHIYIYVYIHISVNIYI